MSEFQLSLLVSGAVTIAGVWAYNRWQERRHRQAAEKLIGGQREDVLLKDAPSEVMQDAIEPVVAPVSERESAVASLERVEPTLGDEPAAADVVEPAAVLPVPETVTEDRTAPSAEAPARRGDALAPEPATVEPSPSAVATDDVAPADTLADCIMRFSLPAPVAAASVWAAQSTWSPGISKTVVWLGRNGGDLAWRFVTADAVGRYAEWIAALPLADRRGPVSDADISQFLDGVQQVAGQLGVAVELPGRAETLQRAQELDGFCAAVDIQFSIHVVEASGGSFAGTKLRGVCEAAGLVLDTDGVFRARDEDGAELFSIANMGSERFSAEAMRTLATHGITLTLDVPRVADGTVAFARMITTAQQLARGLGGILVDAQRAPLAEAMTGLIRSKIAELQQRMKAAQILPGSARALKLFS